MNPVNNINPEPAIDFASIKLSLASPDQILDWSNGEVTKPETINYRTQKPEKDGLFCEKIFGPTKDWACYCGKYKGIRYKGVVCDKCGVLVTRSIVRRERMGHIQLAVPVTHIWFLRGTPSSVSLVLNIGVRDLERIAYFANFVVTDVNEEAREVALAELEKDFIARREDIVKANPAEEGSELSESARLLLDELDENYNNAKAELSGLAKYQLLPEGRYRDLNLKFGEVFKAGIGAEAINQLLKEINIKELIDSLREEADNATGQKKKKIFKRLKAIEGLESAGIRPEWMVISTLPVIPPDLRPMVQLDGGRFAASDLNDLYRRVINRNNRLKKLYALEAPEVICRNEKRMLQEAVDALIDNNARRERAVSAATSRKKLKSLTDLLKGKQGRFRQNLLGKRVDYSGRSVIVIGPHLKLDQCGLPKMMALELFKPFVIGRLIEQGLAHNVKSASRMIERVRTEVWDALDEVIKDKYVLLNRAPTLHRLGIQAFKPILIEGKAIQLHPMVCVAFNADFDGDQMAVHIPLSDAAQKEARDIMLSRHNLLKPSSGDPVVNPSQEIVLGCYYLTMVKAGAKGEGKIFADSKEAVYAYQDGHIGLQAPIKVRVNGQIIETTAGRIQFNSILPDGFAFQNEVQTKSSLRKLMAQVFSGFGNDVMAQLVDDIKQLGFRYATMSGVSIGMDDFVTPQIKHDLIADGEKRVTALSEQYEQGLITESERYEKTVGIWKEVSEAVEASLKEMIESDSNSTFSLDIASGARTTVSQVNQMAGMLGLMLNPSGRIIELPIRSNYRDGLSVLEYFISTHGARKGLTDTALKTAESGYLTRRLVDVAQDVVITELDCGDKEGYLVTAGEAIAAGEESLAPWLVGRTSLEKVVNPMTNDVIVKKLELIDDQKARAIVNAGIESVRIRSILKCRSTWGICEKCYGIDLATGKPVRQGEAVGIMSAQSIGEPGTQLTMNTKHLAGVAGDITQGLPRVQEIFEVRNPKGEAVLSEVSGVVKVVDDEAKTVISVTPPDLKTTEYPLKEMTAKVKSGQVVEHNQVLAENKTGKRTIKAGANGTVKVGKDAITLIHDGGNTRSYAVPTTATILVNNGDLVSAGHRLTEGSVNLQSMLKLSGEEAVQRYIVDEVQAIYASQGQAIASKHIEVIIRQMFSRVMIEEPNDTNFVSGDIVSQTSLQEENSRVLTEKGKPATFEQLLLPITKISTSSDSWLSAASFQETTRVLIGAAIRGKHDHLRGLKENVIIGRLIPVGTGFRDAEESEV